jgi:hypothetical protein
MRTLKFHQGFKLDRARLATLLGGIATGQVASKKTAAAAMGVGEPAAEGCLGWLLKTGLASARDSTYVLTPLGTIVAAHDPHLSQLGTLWLLHYHLVTEHVERAEVWYRAFNEFLNPGMLFTRDALRQFVERSLDKTPVNKSGVDSDCKEFVKCYIDVACLAKLELVREVEKSTYETMLYNAPEPYVFAFALFDAWRRRFPHVDTLRVSQICSEPEMPGRVFAARREQVVQALQSLQSMGLVNIVDSQHEPVTRRFHDEPWRLIEHYYISS